MKKLLSLIAACAVLLFAGCATVPSTTNADPLADIKLAVSGMDAAINIAGPIVVDNLCVFDPKDCDTIKADLKTAQDAMVVVQGALDAAVAVQGANGTSDKVLAALNEVAQHIGDINKIAVDVSGKPLISIPPLPTK